MLCSFIHTLLWKRRSKCTSLIHTEIVFWNKCEVRGGCMLVLHPFTKTEPFYYPSPPNLPLLNKAGINPPNHIKDDWYPWQLIISIIRWFLVSVISPPSPHIHLQKLLNAQSRLSDLISASGWRNLVLVTALALCREAEEYADQQVLRAKLIRFSQRSWLHRHMNV